MTSSAPPKIEKPLVGRNLESSVVKTKRSAVDWLALATKIIAWQIAAILVVEFTLALAGLGEEEIFKLDPRYGFVHMNNKHITWRSEGYSKSFFGPDGMREAGLTIQKPAGVFRVALLGDSIVESLQVPFEQTFGQVLEKSIKKTAHGKELQVLNFGNSGYSTAQEYLQLKNKVLKYNPDAVIVFYNHRDIFENWAPPDQTLTNVRPYALHLPNQPLTIDNSSVIQWMKSPRGKFLTSIEWIREHSRIWGLIAAWETQASFHDPVYRSVVGFFTSPVKTVKACVASLSTVTPEAILDSVTQTFKSKSKSASFSIQFIDDKKKDATERAERKTDGKQEETAKSPTAVATGESDSKPDHSKDKLDAAKASYILDAPSLKDFPAARVESEEEQKALDAKAAEIKAKDNYLNLMFKTLRSVLSEMDKDCKSHNAQFAVAIAPSKLALVEKGESLGLMDLSYDKEIAVVREFCQSEKIPFADMQQNLQAMPGDQAAKLFYSMHLTKQGHDYVVSESQKLFKTLLGSR
ncbi:MAG: SGNH/GDSL hydrolase family protein [Candidatus Melainabacteria bacterium]|nr:SGNH/GDSL hydrolase family protein [Candidatus Melainabacteria bacterium]